MSWNLLTFDVPDDLIDAVAGEFAGDSIGGIWEVPGSQPDTTRLHVYLRVRSNLDAIEELVRTIFERARYPLPVFSRTVVEEADWTGEWKKSYRSFPVADSFFIVPSWEKTACPEDRLPIRIDPGQAFGTGTHETTQLTMEALERWVDPAHVVLDVGTGSGILAIASRLLGAKQVFAFDIDPIAAEVARANIERNLETDVFTFCGSLEAVRTNAIDLLLGNLTAEVIMSLAPEFDRVIRAHGVAIVSGILREQDEEVREILAAHGFAVFEEITQGEWVVLILEKHGR